jgi:hypothetical protein
VYAFASVDHPVAARSLVFDSDGTTAVGGFIDAGLVTGVCTEALSGQHGLTGQ